ncbi:hypothetical protein BT93_G1382 [Corymbia citriodora subsp. variegata]|nr:hypothetical protein BT93_G1382 [Corymbia citriodora subsp. variegata]
MDKDQNELQFLGFLGVYRETSKIILKWRKIFAQITLALILPPLCIIFLAYSLISHQLCYKILDLEITLNAWKDEPEYRKLSRMLEKEWVALWLVTLGYFIFLLISSLLSTSAVVYTVACNYDAKQITFKKIVSIVPRMWRRLMVTFLWCFTLFCVYTVVTVGLLIASLVSMQFLVAPALGIAMGVILSIFFAVGFVYIIMIWKLASTISVLEDVYGKKAMVKSKGLIKGNMGLLVWCSLGVSVSIVLVQAFFESLVLLDWVPIGVKIGVGLICLLLLSKVMLIDLVVQTVIYFVCKSYHHEIIDSSLW